jgi:nucleoside-specific outer membrane channel protein Tsx
MKKAVMKSIIASSIVVASSASIAARASTSTDTVKYDSINQESSGQVNSTPTKIAWAAPELKVLDVKNPNQPTNNVNLDS